MTQETLRSARVETERGGRIPVLVSGPPGRMATLVAEAIGSNGDFGLLPVALCSERHSDEQIQFGDRSVRLVHPRSDRVQYWQYFLKEGAIAIDFSRTDSVLENARTYIYHELPFVMGTSVGDQGDELESLLRNSQISAVIAPNMDMGVVARQIDLDEFAQGHPGIFEDATFEIVESHQASKKDPITGEPIVSGTARAFQEQLERLGAIMKGEIISIRDPERQRELGVPEKFIGGHGYHWVTVYGANGEVLYQFETIVNGRNSYVEGTLTAASYLAIQRQNGSRGEVHTMRDVVRDLRRIAV